MNIQKDKKTIIRDPIYGFIEIDDQEREIINHKYFQRLRRIKQLSMTDMVYPGACHTRFEHSLGVMQMVTDMFENIVKNDENMKLLNLERNTVYRTKKVLRLAALLHDTGHPPFSHAGEEAMPVLPKNHPNYEVKENKIPKFDHEHYSRAAINFVFNDIIERHALGENNGISTNDVLFLLGDKTVKPRRTLMILKELISGQLDADRADYLLRDSLHLGINYGLYDRNRFVNCITLGENKETGSVSLAIKKGGIQIAESLVIARYQMFSQVYFHKVRRIFDYHIGNALTEILKLYKFKNGTFPAPINQKSTEKYLDLDDWKIQGAIQDGKGGKHGEHILLRKPYKRIKKWEGVLTEDMEQEIECYKSKYKDVPNFLDKSVSTKWYKLDKDIDIFDDRTGETFLLSKKSQLIEAIGQPDITRFYVAQ